MEKGIMHLEKISDTYENEREIAISLAEWLVDKVGIQKVKMEYDYEEKCFDLDSSLVQISFRVDLEKNNLLIIDFLVYSPGEGWGRRIVDSLKNLRKSMT